MCSCPFDLLVAHLYLFTYLLPGLGGKGSRNFSITLVELGSVHSTSLNHRYVLENPFTRKNATKMHSTVCDECIPENICVNKSILTSAGN